MPFRSETYRILIASPSDLSEERDAVTEAIHDWNAQHAVDEAVTLLPVKWETHSLPQSNVRPQSAINTQLVAECDILIGMFWTKLGTHTGVAASGTVEEIDQFVAAGKPALLYFSSRPINPAQINLEQLKMLRDFKEETYKNALIGSFGAVDELRHVLSHHLMKQVRMLKKKKTRRGIDRVEQAEKVMHLLRLQKEHGITTQEIIDFQGALNLGRRTKSVMTDPLQPGEVGPNGYRVGYTNEGDKVEWLPDDESPQEEWPMILRRGDKAIGAAYNEFWDKVWWTRHQNWLYRIETGAEPLTETQKPILEQAKKAARRLSGSMAKRTSAGMISNGAY